MPTVSQGPGPLPSLNPYAASDPDYMTRQLQLQRNQQLAQALTQQGMSPIDYDPRGRISWTQGAAKLASALMGGYMSNQNIPEQAKLTAMGQALMQRGGFGIGDSNGPSGITNSASRSTGGAANVDPQASSGSVQPAPAPAPVSPQSVAQANQSSDPIGALNSSQGWTGPTATNNPPAQPPQTSAPSPQPPMQAPTGPLVMSGMSPQQSYLAYTMDPQGYMQALIARSDNRTDVSKSLLSMGIDPSSQIGAQVMAQWLRKETYIAPTNASPGSWSINPDGTKAWNPEIPKGGMPAYDQNGNMVGTLPMPGAATVTQTQSQAETLGRTSGTLYDTIDPATHRGTKAPGSDFLGSNAPPVNAGRFGGYAAPGNPKPVTSLAPGEADLATGGAKRYNDLQTAVQDSRTRVNVLDNNLSLSNQGVATGPTQDWRNRIMGALGDSSLGQRVGQIAGSDPKSDVARYQEITKFMKQNAMRSWQAAGGTGTDAQLDAQTEANVNKGMFPQAVQDVALWQKGGELALQAKAQAAAQWRAGGGSPLDQDQFESAWRSHFDPRVFQMRAIAQFDPSRLSAYTAKIPPAERSTLADKYQLAVRNGWFQ